MLAELIKLSRELFEMELVKESLEIDDLIHKLYGVGGNTPNDVCEEVCFEEDFGSSYKNSSLDDLKNMIIVNANDEEFKTGISDILIDSLSISDLENIKEVISEYLE